MRDDAIRPIFVLGSPRSGTTLIGSFLGSDPGTYDVGEYNAFYLTHRVIPERMPGIQPPEWEPHLARYLSELRAHASCFNEEVARAERCDSYVDSSPRNLLIVDELAHSFPDAVFVLMLRHYSGVIQSLGRSGWPWVPIDVGGRADVWAEAYEHASLVPRERTVVVSYDALCAAPAETLFHLSGRLSDLGVRVERLDANRLSYSHAHILGQPRPTLRSDSGELRPIPSIDVVQWTPTIHAAVEPHVALVDARLRRDFPEYVVPNGWSPPTPPAGGDVFVAEHVSPALVSAEFIVTDLDRVEEFFVELLGLDVVRRSRHPDFDAENVLLTAGPVAVSLLHPTDVGDRPPFPLIEPRLSHLTFAIDDETKFAALRTRLVEAGAAVVHSGPRMFHLPDEFMRAVLGQSLALVILQLDGEDAE